MSVSGSAAEEVVKLQSITFEEKLPDDDFALTFGERSLFLGLDKKAALEAFPPVDKAIEFSSLPSQFAPEKFGSFGWEANGLAFGCITYERTDSTSMLTTDTVVQAMFTREDVDQDTIDTVLKSYTDSYGEPLSALPGNRIGYWFWSKPGRRLMVNTAVGTHGRKSLTVAVGETQVMTLLGMSFEQARKDKDRAIQRLNNAAAP